MVPVYFAELPPALAHDLMSTRIPKSRVCMDKTQTSCVMGTALVYAKKELQIRKGN